MQIEQNISLKPYNTFGIDVKAKHFVSVDSIAALLSVLDLEAYPEKFILGGGSNMLLTKDITELVVHVNIKGIEVIDQSEDHVLVKVNAGENWHSFVMWCLEHNFGGIENLSLIPGNVGTAPIQNIGAYGVELKDVFESCEAIHIPSKTLTTFSNSDCEFAYRDSIFKSKCKGEYIITSVTFKLTTKNHDIKTSYGAILDELQQRHITNPTIKEVSNAVIAIRQSKLPDPKEIGNSGSFFKNPIVSKAIFLKLKAHFPDVPHYVVSESEIKVPAGWLIEKAGFKGKTLGDYGVHKKQALVLVNYGNASGADILELSLLIKKTIERLFGITIETEVNVI